jgi:hypothetical protein
MHALNTIKDKEALIVWEFTPSGYGWGYRDFHVFVGTENITNYVMRGLDLSYASKNSNKARTSTDEYSLQLEINRLFPFQATRLFQTR